MTKRLTFITGNPSKAEQLARYLGVEVDHKNLDLDEIQSVVLAEVLEHMARQAYKDAGVPVLVDDVALSVKAMGKLPGPFIKFFIQELDLQGICNLVQADRSAVAEVGIAYCDKDGIEFFSGVVDGCIAKAPRGEGGFGWDAIFIPEGYEQTRAEMAEEDYDATSPRKLALDKLEEFLRKTT